MTRSGARTTIVALGVGAVAIACGANTPDVRSASTAGPADASVEAASAPVTAAVDGASLDSSGEGGLAECAGCVLLPNPAPSAPPVSRAPAATLVPLFEWSEPTYGFHGDRALVLGRSHEWLDAADPTHPVPLKLPPGLRDKVAALDPVGDRVLAWQSDGTVHAIAISDGKELWKWSAPQPAEPEFAAHLHAVLVADDLLVAMPRVKAEPTRVYALDVRSGTLLWSFLPHTGVSRAARVGDVVALADASTLAGVDARTGAPRWEYTTGSTPYAEELVGGRGVFLWRIDSREVHVVDVNGKLVERRVPPEGARVERLLPSGSERACVQIQQDIRTTATSRLLCADATTGAAAWSWPPAGRDATFIRGWWSFDDLVVAQATDDGVVGLDARTGAERWHLGTTGVIERLSLVAARGGGIALTYPGDRDGMFAVADPPAESPVDVKVLAEAIVQDDPDPDAVVTAGTSSVRVGRGGELTLRTRASGTLQVRCGNKARPTLMRTFAVPRLGGTFHVQCMFSEPGAPRTTVQAGQGACGRDADCTRRTDCCGRGTTCSSVPESRSEQMACGLMGACGGPSTYELATQPQFVSCVCRSGRCASKVTVPEIR
jgi:outer membrane protein assembly factor BamB